MNSPETNSQAGPVRLPPDEWETQQSMSLRERTAARLESRRFHSSVFALIIMDCIIVIIELCFTLTNDCLGQGAGGDEYRPEWLMVCTSYLHGS